MCHRHAGSGGLCLTRPYTVLYPFEILFGRKSRTSLDTLDTLVPQIDDSEAAEGLENFIKQRRVLREVRQVLEKRQENRIVTRESTQGP